MFAGAPDAWAVAMSGSSQVPIPTLVASSHSQVSVSALLDKPGGGTMQGSRSLTSGLFPDCRNLGLSERAASFADSGDFQVAMGGP